MPFLAWCRAARPIVALRLLRGAPWRRRPTAAQARSESGGDARPRSVTMAVAAGRTLGNRGGGVRRRRELHEVDGDEAPPQRDGVGSGRETGSDGRRGGCHLPEQAGGLGRPTRRRPARTSSAAASAVETPRLGGRAPQRAVEDSPETKPPESMAASPPPPTPTGSATSNRCHPRRDRAARISPGGGPAAGPTASGSCPRSSCRRWSRRAPASRRHCWPPRLA